LISFKNKQVFGFTVVLAFLQCSAVFGSDLNGSIELEGRYFFEDDPRGLSQKQTSIRLELEASHSWNSGDDIVVLEPFIRLDSEDDERSHFDIRQLVWTHYGENYETSAGISKVFWGVTESQHLVDIINQTDSVENIDGEDKLGQPLFKYSYFSDFGNIDAFVLPYFRPRTFAGENGRLNANFLVETNTEEYQSNKGQSNVDFAIRYSQTYNDFDIGLSWFDGTSREADIFKNFDRATGETIPFYSQITQFGADIQYTTGALSLKLEAIQRNHRNNILENYAALTTGFEYTFVGVFDSSYDLGVIAEYSWDERGETSTSLFQNDLFIGGRLALNDLSDSAILLGMLRDFDNSDSGTVSLEASTRISSGLVANIELRYFESDTPTDLLFQFRDNSFLQVGLEYFF
jgi:hypothetical protein